MADMNNNKNNKKKNETQKRSDRREFLQTSTATAAMGVGFWAAGGVAAKATRSKLEKVNFACIGVGGKGASDSTDAKRTGQIAAICDIDDEMISKKQSEEGFKDARTFHDFRELFDQMGDKFDAVTVSTPDHTHAVATLQAIQMGKHCYTQKPLTHSIEEARMLGDAAREAGVITQMGNQGTADSNLRQSAALVKKGVVGEVKEVHVWTNRPVWPQSYNLDVKTEPAEGEEEAWNQRRKEVKWDLWLGPAKKRPYSPEIHPFKWRGFWDFGTGALGDMACHTLNMSYMAMDLKFPTSVVAEADKHDGVCYPAWSKITFEFPATDDRGAVTMVWYDGGQRPPAELLEGLPKDDNGRMHTSAALLVGEKGNFYSPGDYGGDAKNTGVLADGTYTSIRDIVRGKDPFAEFKRTEFVRSPGHFEEFVESINSGEQAVSNFPDYAGPLTETILLGNLAVWSKKKVQWDAENMIAKDADEATQKLIRHDYPEQFTIHNALVH